MPRRSEVARDIKPEELIGLRYAEYIRESDAKQLEGFSPDAQHRANSEWAQRYGLKDSGLAYTEAGSAKDAAGRPIFLQALDDLRSGWYQVLLIAHPNRFMRNVGDAELSKRQIRDAGGILVYTHLNMISGQRSTFIPEGIHHLLDQQYREDLSMYVASGLKEKFLLGFANGVPPLGTKNTYLRRDGSPADARDRNSRAVRVVDKEKIPTLLALLSHYAEAGSTRKTAQWLNSQGFRNREGQLFTQDSIKETIRNPYYGPDEIMIYHKNRDDEIRRPTPKDAQIFPDEIHELWLRCQQKKDARSVRAAASTRSFIYPIHEILCCATCESTYNGQPTKTAKGTYRHSVHKKRGVECAKPGQVKTEEFEAQILEMLTHVRLPRNWQSDIKRLLGRPRIDDHASERNSIQGAMRRVKEMYE